MKHPSISILAFLSLIATAVVIAQDSPFRKLEIITTLQRPPAVVTGFAMSDPRIKDFHVLNPNSGIVYTSDAIFRTDDGGDTWRTLPIRREIDQRIATVWFANEREGLVLLGDTQSSRVEIARTADGGSTWTKNAVDLENAADYELDLESASFAGDMNGSMDLSIRIPTSSNFTGRALYRSADGGLSWYFVSRSIELRRDIDASPTSQKGNWMLETSGECSGHKNGCVQETRLYISGKDTTPPRLRELQKNEKERTKKESANRPMFAMPPGGSTRISLNRGFDKCQAGSVAQMQLWWDNSYFFDSNIYFSGRNRACPSQPYTNNPAWINQVSAMGWGLIPTVVGYQSPCTASTTTAKLSYDPAVSEQQGRGEADISAADAVNIGLTAGSILYYDMERYDPPTPDTLGCRPATVAFLKGWTNRVKELGYKSGTYGSPKNAIEDWQFMSSADRMDAVWMARWDNVISVWTYVSFANFPTNVWDSHQRIKQWQAPHNETWAGVTFNIDGNIADAPVAGIPVPKNKVADFDGDDKTDISVYRPSTGQWFISGSLGPTFSIYEFGASADILAPGDYDGDGKTDFVVFRPSDTTWYLRTKGGTFNTRQYGATGDIPAPADYNGDGKTDVAVFRPSTGLWYISYTDSHNSFATIQFGENGDKPVAADYDGDGKADIAVWRPSNGTWYVQGSGGYYFTATWGEAADLPAQADYDGDGKTDFAVFRSGTWYLLRTTDGILVQQFGVSGDIPSTGDFDGDGRYDIAVFRPSDGNWYLSQSQAGYAVRTFGVANDKPVPAGYLPQ